MKPVLAREREARFNVEHCPKVFQSSPSMIKTLEANPNTSCGLRPRLRRELDHAEREEESAVFILLLAFSMLQPPKIASETIQRTQETTKNVKRIVVSEP